MDDHISREWNHRPFIPRVSTSSGNLSLKREERRLSQGDAGCNSLTAQFLGLSQGEEKTSKLQRSKRNLMINHGFLFVFRFLVNSTSHDQKHPKKHGGRWSAWKNQQLHGITGAVEVIKNAVHETSSNEHP